MATASKAGSSSSNDSRVSVKVKLISEPAKRMTSRGEWATAVAIESSSQALKDVNMPIPQMAKLKAGTFYLLKNVSVGDSIRVFDNSKIMHCGKFAFPQNIEESYFNPPTVSVMEAVKSPRKRRVSIEGELTDVSPVWTSGTTRRKILKVSNENKSIDVKLWGEQVDISIPSVGQKIKVQCLTIGEYLGVKDANSTELTQIEEVGEKEEFHGIIEAATFDPEDYSILLEAEENEWRIEAENFSHVFPLGLFEENVQIRGHRCGRRIVDVERIDESEDVEFSSL